MLDAVKYVDVLLEGRMPKLRQKVMELSKQRHRPSGSHGAAGRTPAPRMGYTQLPSRGGHVFVSFASKSSAGNATSLQSLLASHPDSDHVVTISNIGSGSTVQGAIHALVEKLHQPRACALAIAPREVVNNPQVQSLVQQIGRGTRFGFLVEDEPAEVTLEQIYSALGKWLAFWQEVESDERSDHPPYLSIRQRLSDENSGRLDGSKIAKLFGLSTAEMGKICGVSKQSFHANPTSKGIQDKLEPLERVARGILWCAGDEGRFRAWLNQPNRDFPELDGKQLSPLDLIRIGHAQVVADKVQNLLTGHPA